MDRTNIQKIIALGASIVVAIQIGLILVGGNAICPNEGCKIIEEQTRIPPLGINIIGLAYFQSLFWVLRRYPKRGREGYNFPNLLMLAGLAAESVLFSFQLFVVQVFCIYCLLIFAVILVLNLLSGKRQTVSGMSLALAIMIGFSVLSFKPVSVSSQPFTLQEGTYGTRSCAQPTKQIYFIFSENCSHCLKVMETLNNCNSCELHLNPIDIIKDLRFADIELNASYSPRINRQILSMFGIQEIPVILVNNQGDFSFIQGEKKIIEYISHACFTQKPTLYLNRSQYTSQDQISAFLQDEGKCSIDIDCADGENFLSQPE